MSLLKFTDEMKLHHNAITIALYLEQSLFVTDAMTDPRYAFAEKIHQNLIHTSGRLGNVARCSSVSTSALSSLVELMKLWRRNKSINKPVLCDILTIGKISAHVSNEILNWTHQMFLDGLSFQAITTSPQLSYKILQFLGETLVSQQ